MSSSLGFRARAIGLLVILLCSLSAARVRAAESGSTLTPDRSSYLVNKDIGSDRWTIGFNVVGGDPNRFINVTGNVFRSEGGAPTFVVCQVNGSSLGTLNDPSSVFSLTCRGADACATTAKGCAAGSWNSISDDVRIGADFFLPAAGRGSAGAVASGGAGRCDGLACVVERLLHATLASSGRVVLDAMRAAALPEQASAQSNDRGATLSYDQLAYLVSKDIGNERWSIALNVVPAQTDQGTTSQIESVTGNVFKRDGSAPSFVYCTQNADSQGTLDDPSSSFHFSCSGTSACASTAEDCAQRWDAISDDVTLPASFFLPPGGLPKPAQSDPQIFIIGNTSDPSSYVTKDFNTGSGSSAVEAGPAGTCPVGAACSATRIGSCTDVSGRIVQIDGFGCGCQVDDVPQCVTCGSGASGTCGGDCEFPVGQSTARGECLPASSDSSECACYAIGAGQQQTVTGCSGPLDAACAADRCCADDPRDGCDLATGDVSCAGICVPSSCPAGQACGICLARQQGGACPNGVREGNEQCDGSDVPSSCGALGFASGRLACTADCRFDVSGCSAPVTPTPTDTVTPSTPTPADTGPTPPGSTPSPSPTPTTGVTPSPSPTPTPTTAVTPSPSPTAQGDPCPYVVSNGDASGLDVIVNVGAPSGSLTLTYAPSGDPMIGGDAFSVETLDGQVIFSSGCVFDPGPGMYPPLTDTFSFSGGPSLRLKVQTFCNGGSGVDFWSVNLSCGS